MEKLIQGIRRFQESVYKEKQTLFKELARGGQNPDVLFITCSDSRVVPHLITQTQPGDMFIIQNAGNIIPPHGAAHGGIGASIEYAVAVLNVNHVVLCGHSQCGAMKALMDDTAGGAALLDNLPNVKHWLSFAETTKAIVDATAGKGLKPDERLELCIEQNIPVQLDHLRTIPAVALRLAKGDLRMHGWVYHIESARIDVWNPALRGFEPFEQAYPLVPETAPPKSK